MNFIKKNILLYLLLLPASAAIAQDTYDMLMTVNGKELDGHKYTYVSPYDHRNHVGKALLDGKDAFLDTLGHIQAICPQGRAVWKSGSYKSRARHLYGLKGGRWAMLNSQFEPLTSFVYEKMEWIHPQLAKVQKNDLWGLVDTLGNEVTPCTYNSIDDFTGDFTTAWHKTKEPGAERVSGILYKNGKLIISTKEDFSEMGYFQNSEYGVVSVRRKNGKDGIIDNTGKEVTPAIYNDIYKPRKPEYPLATIILNRENASFGYGAVDRTGQVAIKADYDKIETYSQGAIAMNDDDNIYYLFNSKGELKLTSKNRIYEYDGAIEMRNDSATVYYDFDGNIIKTEYDEDKLHKRGAYYDWKTGNWGYSDGKKLIIPCMYDYLVDIDGSHFIVDINDKEGIIDINNKVMMPIKHQNIDILQYNRCVVRKGNDEAIHDWHGKRLTPFIFHLSRLKFDPTLFIARNSKSKWSMYNIDGKQVIPEIYDDYDDMGHGYYLVSRSGNHAILDVRTLKEVIPARYYHYIAEIGYHIARSPFVVFTNNNKRGAYVATKQGLKTIPAEYDMIKIMPNKAIMVQKDNKWGIIDEDNNIIIPIENKYIEQYYNDILIVSKFKE